MLCETDSWWAGDSIGTRSPYLTPYWRRSTGPTAAYNPPWPVHHHRPVAADGRYAAKLAALRPIMSEHGYMHRRVQVEMAWFIALSDAGFAEFKPPLSRSAR